MTWFWNNGPRRGWMEMAVFGRDLKAMYKGADCIAFLDIMFPMIDWLLTISSL